MTHHTEGVNAMNPVLKPKELAARCHVSLVTLRRWIKRGLCPPYQKTPTGLYFFAEADVERWLAGMAVDPTGQSEIVGQ